MHYSPFTAFLQHINRAFLFLLFAGFIWCLYIHESTAAETDTALPRISRFAFPDKPVRFIVPGASLQQDGACLPQAAALLQTSPRATADFPIQPGRGGAIALKTLLEEAPETYTFALVRLPDYFFHLQSASPMFKKSELVPAFLFASAPLALWVPQESPFSSLDDFLVAARKAAPGDTIIAGNGTDTASWLATRQFNRATGIVARYSPLLSQKEVAEATAAGKAQACWGYALAPFTMPGMRPLAVAAQERASALPEVPTFTEADCPMTNEVVFGLALPQTVQEKNKNELLSYMESTLHSPEFKEILQAAGFTPFAVPQEQLTEFLKRENESALQQLEDYQDM